MSNLSTSASETKKKTTRPYTVAEEVTHAVTHGVGFILAIAGLAVLMVFAVKGAGGPLYIIPTVVYSITLMLMYLFSTLYHGVFNARAKRVFRILDHEAIFLLIAGTYTPFLIITLNGVLGWVLFSVVWGVAALGLIFQGFYAGRFRLFSTCLYVGMGWIMVVALKPLAAQLPAAGMRWLYIGGAFYTIGAIIYLFKRIPYHHAVWHLFVLAGSACHYLSILLYVLPG